MNQPETYLTHVDEVAKVDAHVVTATDQQYGGSWKARGGTGAFFIFARKWDRLQQRATEHGYDVFEAALADQRAEGLIDDIRDLRRYLLLVEAFLLTQGEFPLTTRDAQILHESGIMIPQFYLTKQEHGIIAPTSTHQMTVSRAQ